MKGGVATVQKRINISLPEKTVERMDKVVPKRKRSRLIDEAVNYYLTQKGRRNLRKHLEEGYAQDMEFDRRLAEEWFSLDEEAWQKSGL